MYQLRLKTVFIIGLLFIALTGYSNAEAAPNRTLKIKGLYIGMDIDLVPSILHKHLPNRENPEVVKGSDNVTGETGYFVVMYQDDIAVDGREQLLILAGEDKKVESMEIFSSLSDELFNTAGVPEETFRKNFMKAYNIPHMEFTIAQGGLSADWVYLDSSGFKITIVNHSKHIIIEKTVPANKRNFD